MSPSQGRPTLALPLRAVLRAWARTTALSPPSDLNVQNVRLLRILRVLCDGPVGLGTLARLLGPAFGDALAADLAVLEEQRLVRRASWSTSPPRWMYDFTPQGEALRGLIRACSPEDRRGPR